MYLIQVFCDMKAFRKEDPESQGKPLMPKADEA